MSEVELVDRLRMQERHRQDVGEGGVSKLCGAAADTIERLLKERDEARAEVKWREDETAHEVVAARDCEKAERARADAAEAKVAALREAGFAILNKLDHPTASVTQWDADNLRKALEASR